MQKQLGIIVLLVVTIAVWVIWQTPSPGVDEWMPEQPVTAGNEAPVAVRGSVVPSVVAKTASPQVSVPSESGKIARLPDMASGAKPGVPAKNPAGTCSLRIQVVGQDGEFVTMYRASLVRRPGGVQFSVAERYGWRTTPMLSAPRGEYVFTDLRADHYLVRVTAPRYCRAALEVVVAAKNTKTHVIRLRRGLTVHGQITKAGRPVAARVLLREHQPDAIDHPVVLTGRTDEQGRYEFQNVPRGRFVVSAQGEYLCRTDSEPFEAVVDRKVDISLDDFAWIKGRVTGFRQGQKVRVLAVRSRSRFHAARVRDDGHYDLKVPPGKYTVHAITTDAWVFMGWLQRVHFGAKTRPGRFVQAQLTSGGSAVRNLVVDNPRVGKVRGRVLFAGEPSASTRVRLLGREQGSRRRLHYSAITDAEGRFVLKDLAVGEFSLEVLGAGRKPKVLASRLVRVMDKLQEDVEIRLSR